jgi:hypothetical protein
MVTAAREPFSCQLHDNPPAATAGVIQVVLVDTGHDPQGGVAHRHRPVLESRSRKAQQSALTTDDELRVGVIDELAQFIGARATEVFLSHSISIWSMPNSWNSSASLA